jgi:hypothetical protein
MACMLLRRKLFDVDDWRLTETAELHGLLYGSHCHRESCLLPRGATGVVRHDPGLCDVARTREADVAISMVFGACSSTDREYCDRYNFAYEPRVLSFTRSCQHIGTGRMPIPDSSGVFAPLVIQNRFACRSSGWQRSCEVTAPCSSFREETALRLSTRSCPCSEGNILILANKCALDVSWL